MIHYLHKLITDTSFNMGDGAAGSITVATYLDKIPTITAVLSLIWIILRLIVIVRDEFVKRKKDGNE